MRFGTLKSQYAQIPAACWRLSSLGEFGKSSPALDFKFSRNRDANEMRCDRGSDCETSVKPSASTPLVGMSRNSEEEHSKTLLSLASSWPSCSMDSSALFSDSVRALRLYRKNSLKSGNRISCKAFIGLGEGVGKPTFSDKPPSEQWIPNGKGAFVSTRQSHHWFPDP